MLSLKSGMQKTELKKLHFSLRYLSNEKRSKTSRFTWRGRKGEFVWWEALAMKLGLNRCRSNLWVASSITHFKRDGCSKSHENIRIYPMVIEMTSLGGRQKPEFDGGIRIGMVPVEIRNSTRFLCERPSR